MRSWIFNLIFKRFQVKNSCLKQAQATVMQAHAQSQRALTQGQAGAAPQPQQLSSLYPSLTDYMGLSPAELEQATAIAVAHQAPLVRPCLDSIII